MDVRVSEQFERRDNPAVTVTRVAKTWAQQARDAATDTLRMIRERNLTRPILMVGVPALVALVAAYMYFTGGRYVSTDDAYVRAAKLMVTAEVSGVVSEVDVKEGQTVKAGDTLFKIDARPFQIALENAKATLANTALTVESMKQDYQRMLGDINAQRAQVDLAQSNLNRVVPLLAKKFVSRAAYDQARFALSAEQQKLIALQDTAKTQLSKLGGNPAVDATTHPQYLQAKSAVDEAQRQLDHTTVRAPFNGIATQVSSLQPGVYVVSSMAALSASAAVGLVSTDNIWIDANLKETDLTYVKAGDQVDVTIDTYPGKTWKAHVESVGAATGAEFSLLPSNNSSGNWTKVVQRVPVRVHVDREPNDPPLRSGMSAIVDIDTGHQRSFF
ncbi:MAG: HlyD family secretion protein [Alphaproteobacteria bacterium]|jgi:membrane fusion protein (multidrug efflux system)|nr:HlyD family secretion protein [Alphaproteobacteria bacterium]